MIQKRNFSSSYGKICLLIMYIYIYKMGVQMFVCLSVGRWRSNGNPNPCTNLDEIFHAHHHLSKEGFGAGLTPGQINPGSAGYLS